MKILIVDDVEFNRDLLLDILEEDYECETAVGGAEALAILRESHEEFTIVLLDLVMPKENGFDVMEEMKRQGWMADTAVIVISGDDDHTAESKSLKLGAVDFIKKPFDETIVRQRVKTISELYSYKHSMEVQVARQTEVLRQQNQKLQRQAEQIQEYNEKIIDVLGTVVEYRNLESGEHIKRVKDFTAILAEQMKEMYPEKGMTQEQVHLIVAASPLHDIGKITVPDHILLKPGRLTKDEYEIMKQHTTNGAAMLDSMEGMWGKDYAVMCYEICRHHHERYDGRGYPDGLKGDEIPLSAQLVSLADVYDALVSKRIYKDSFSLEEAFTMIMNGDCGVFSPQLLSCFEQTREHFEQVALRNS